MDFGRRPPFLFRAKPIASYAMTKLILLLLSVITVSASKPRFPAVNTVDTTPEDTFSASIYCSSLGTSCGGFLPQCCEGSVCFAGGDHEKSLTCVKTYLRQAKARPSLPEEQRGRETHLRLLSSEELELLYDYRFEELRKISKLSDDQIASIMENRNDIIAELHME